MAAVLTELEPRNPQAVDAALVEAGTQHPMRIVTRAAAAEVGAWTPDTAREVRDLFDELAPDWRWRHTPDRLDALEDALARGLTAADRESWCLELGSGDGWATSRLAGAFPRLLGTDLSGAMLDTAVRDGRATAPLFQADAAALPLADHSIRTAVLINMLLFPFELDRVLALDGALLWISSRSEATPIWLHPTEVDRALPGRWDGVWARCGPATWAVLRRS